MELSFLKVCDSNQKRYCIFLSKISSSKKLNPVSKNCFCEIQLLKKQLEEKSFPIERCHEQSKLKSSSVAHLPHFQSKTLRSVATSEEAKRSVLRTAFILPSVSKSWNMRSRLSLANYAFPLRFEICSLSFVLLSNFDQVSYFPENTPEWRINKLVFNAKSFSKFAELKKLRLLGKYLLKKTSNPIVINTHYFQN